MEYMLDTDTCIYLINDHPKMRAQADPADCGISVIVVGELERGNARSSRPEQNRILLDRFIDGMNVVDLGQDAARAYGAIRVDLETRGEPIGPNDLWIAAHARALGIPLVTNNTREFSRVPRLTVDTWMLD